MSHCGFIELTPVAGGQANPCGKESVGRCVDCGTEVCHAHGEHCESCKELFCGTCLALHVAAKHQKKPLAAIADNAKKETA